MTHRIMIKIRIRIRLTDDRSFLDLMEWSLEFLLGE